LSPKNKINTDTGKTREIAAYTRANAKRPDTPPAGTALSDTENAVYDSIRTVLVTARQKAYAAVNSAMVEAYWDIGRQLEHVVGDRAEYGKSLLQSISKKLSV